MAETWDGDIDLHQGDRGTISFTREVSAITGRIRVRRGQSEQEHSIDGTWTGDQIRFTRRLDASSIQPFEGTASAAGPDHVIMSGRFAANLAGEWSADCRRTSQGPKPTGPNLDLRFAPFHPTADDRITFSATAQHSSGVRDVTHFINGKAVRTCTTERCIHEAGPFPAGTITWGVRARSNNGGENSLDDHTIVIAPATAGGRCRLRCRAVGPQASRASAFFVAISRPGESRAIATKSFSNAGGIEFENLPEGRLHLLVDARADLPVRAQPSTQEVTCREDQLAEAVFTFL